MAKRTGGRDGPTRTSKRLGPKRTGVRLGLKRTGGRLGRSDSGMSLIELLVAIALIGFLLVVGLPSFQEWLERYRVRTAAEAIGGAVQLQRMRAVSGNRSFSIEFDTVGGGYTLYDGEPGDWTVVAGGVRFLPERVTFQAPGDADPVEFSFGGEEDVIVFHADGSLNDRLAEDDEIYLRSGFGDRFRVVVNKATGRTDIDEIE